MLPMRALIYGIQLVELYTCRRSHTLFIVTRVTSAFIWCRLYFIVLYFQVAWVVSFPWQKMTCWVI